MSLVTFQSELSSYDSLKKKLLSIEEDNYRRIGKIISYYCVLSDLYPHTFCVIMKENNRCAMFEEVGPGEKVPKNVPAHVKSCRCLIAKNPYSCPLYLRFSQIYFDVMEDVNRGNKGKEEKA